MSNSDAFITPETYLKRQSAELESAEGKLLIACLQPAKYLALTINRIHFNSSVSEVFYNPPE